MVQAALPEDVLGDEQDMEARFRLRRNAGNLGRAEGQVLHDAKDEGAMLQARVVCVSAVTAGALFASSRNSGRHETVAVAG